MDNKTRAVALVLVPVFLFGTLIGSLLPESGNVLAQLLRLPGDSFHTFNGMFLVIGILGIGLALHIGHRTCSQGAKVLVGDLVVREVSLTKGART